MNKKRITVNSRDFLKLKQIIKTGAMSRNINAKNLDAELSNAVILEPEKIPPNLITMNTRVSFRDLTESEVFVYTIVYPEEADIEKGKLSVFAPIGTALLGYKEGEEVAWHVPAGLKSFRVEKILYQPEADGNYYL